MLDLHDELSSLARQWESDSPPLTLAETIARAGGPVAPDELDSVGSDESFVAVNPVEQARRRWTPLLMAAAAAVAIIVGLVALTRGNGSDQQPFRPGDETIAPQPTPVGSVPLTTLTTLVSSTVAPNIVTTTPGPSTTSVDGGTPGLSAVQSGAAVALARFDAFRATATMHVASTSSPGGDLVEIPVSVSDVVLAADGSMWSEGTPVEWSSYDATTGIARTQGRRDDGTESYMQINDWSSIPLEVIIGLDPVPDLSALGTNVEIDDALQDGRQVWQISSQHDTTQPDGAVAHSDETLAIDKSTGLVIGFARTVSESGSVTSVQTATLTNLEVGVEVPPPGFSHSFPPDADVQGAGSNPPSFHLLTADQAAARFGTGFVAPTGLPRTARIFAEGGPVVSAAGEAPVIVPSTAIQTKVTMEFPDGFAPRSITVSKNVSLGERSSGEAGASCRTLDGKTCVGAGGSSVITAGALKGVPSDLHLGVLTIHDGLVTIEVRAPTDSQALDLANSLRRIG